MAAAAGRRDESKPFGTGGETLRLAELLAAVSLATDLADEAPAGSALGDAITVVDFAQLVGLGAEAVSDIYYLALLYHVGCTAAATAQARIGGGEAPPVDEHRVPVRQLGSASGLDAQARAAVVRRRFDDTAELLD